MTLTPTNRRVIFGLVAYGVFLALVNIMPTEWGHAAGVWTRETLGAIAGGQP